MTDTSPTPAELLRAAAELLREAAGHATPGPWRTHDTHLGGVGGHTATVLTDRPNLNDTELIAWLPTMSHEPWDEARNAWRNAGWMALMHPGVGLALAAWLDLAAVEYDATVRGAAGVWAEPGDERERDTWVEQQTNQHALAVARQLLGTTETEDATAQEREPVQLRWGLDDVMYGDDDTTTVLLSGPGREPYWVELDPERTAALREALAGPDAPPAPADRAAVLHEAAERLQRRATQLGAVYLRADQVIDAIRRIADEKAEEDRLADDAAGVQPPTTTDPLADCATEYHVPVPEHGGTELLVRRQALAHGAGWAVSTRARGGGRAWTTEGWQDSISALSVDRLFCWPDPATAVDAARRALAAPAAPEEPQ